MGETLNLTRWQTVQVNEKTFETTVDGVFSGGDVVTGAATAIEAIAAGRKAAYAIDTYIREGRARPEPEEFLSRKDAFSKVTHQGPAVARNPRPGACMPMIPVDERVRGLRRGRAGLLGGGPAPRRRRGAWSAAASRCSTATSGSTRPSTASR